jgi:hypothetical protein
MTEITTMRIWMAYILLFSTAAMAAPDGPGRKRDIDTSPRVFASANGRYWVRVTTRREMGDEGSRWTTQMVVSHAQDCAEEEKVASRTTLDTFPDRVLVSDKGDIIIIGQYASVGWRGAITVYGPDGVRRGATEFAEFLEPLQGAERRVAWENLRYVKGPAFEYYSTDFLVIPLGPGKVARVSLATGRPA